MWIEDEDSGRLGSDVIRVIIVESGICLDIVLEEGVHASQGAPCVVFVGPGTKTLRVSVCGPKKLADGAAASDQKKQNEDPVRFKFQKSNLPLLSPREIEVLSHLSSGEANKEIARKMNISDETVRGHIKSIFRKTGMENRTQAALWALSLNSSKDPQD